MPVEVGEMTFLEQLAKQFDIPTPEYLTADAPRSEIRSALDRWGGKGIIKPDILAGKRGKAGEVSVVTTAAEAMKKLKLAAAAEISGKNARTAYLVQFVPSEQEVYTAITYDSRWLGPSFT
ncbi:MAG: hypothetical protein KAV00_07435, partial [Phycisphaerae bacterium]|nr:hypothetical protein [Phycisphaerae bacterium]